MPQIGTLPGRATLASPDLAKVVADPTGQTKFKKQLGLANPPTHTHTLGHAFRILDRSTGSLGRAEGLADPLQDCPTVARAVDLCLSPHLR